MSLNDLDGLLALVEARTLDRGPFSSRTKSTKRTLPDGAELLTFHAPDASCEGGCYDVYEHTDVEHVDLCGICYPRQGDSHAWTQLLQVFGYVDAVASHVHAVRTVIGDTPHDPNKPFPLFGFALWDGLVDIGVAVTSNPLARHTRPARPTAKTLPQLVARLETTAAEDVDLTHRDAFTRITEHLRRSIDSAEQVWQRSIDEAWVSRTFVDYRLRDAAPTATGPRPEPETSWLAVPTRPGHPALRNVQPEEVTWLLQRTVAANTGEIVVLEVPSRELGALHSNLGQSCYREAHFTTDDAYVAAVMLDPGNANPSAYAELVAALADART